MAILKSRLNANAHESIKEVAFTPDRTEGIDTPDNWEPSLKRGIAEAERYDSGRVDGVNVYRCPHPGQNRRHGKG